MAEGIRISRMIDLLTILYATCAVLLALYTSGQAILLLRFWRTYRRKTTTPTLTHFPTVAVQLPLYNEQYVAKRLINAVAGMAYPREKLWIQVLDDSTDGTATIATLVGPYR